MLEWIECNPSCLPRRAIAKAVGNEAVRRLVKGHRDNDRQHPGARLVEHRGKTTDWVHCPALSEISPHLSSASNSSSASRRLKSLSVEQRRMASARVRRSAAQIEIGPTALTIASISRR